MMSEIYWRGKLEGRVPSHMLEVMVKAASEAEWESWRTTAKAALDI